VDLLTPSRLGCLPVLAGLALALACATVRDHPAHALRFNHDEMSAKVDEIFADFEARGVPGASIAIFRGDDVLLAESRGVANREDGTPVTPDTNFRLASVTKQFTAMSILLLRGRGQLDLDDPIRKFFPNLPEIGDEITIRHLLTHTSGIISYENLMPEDQVEQLKDRDVLALVQTQHGTYFTPGTAYRYSNSGYAFLSLIVEEVSGLRYPDFLRVNIFEPLGMEGTVAFEEGRSTVPRRAMGYALSDGEVIPRDQSLTSAVLGDGGIYCSVMNYQKWDKALRTEQLVSDAVIEEAYTPVVLPDDTSTGYGFGWRVDERDGVRIVHHNGGTCGFSTAVRRVPKVGLSIVVLTNLAQGDAPAAADALLDSMLTASAD
jgi:CubicO group peptidase (beta-lactamase class C family)